MTPKLQAMLARVEELEAEAQSCFLKARGFPGGPFAETRIAYANAIHYARNARAKFNRAVREESEREANLP